MFTGIVESCVPIRQCRSHGKNVRVTFALPRRWKLTKGESVNCDGVCSTVITTTTTTFTVEYMPTTIRRTRVAHFVRGMPINLERSLRLADRLSGHFVTGHCDGCVRVIKEEQDGHSRVLTLAHPRSFHHLLIPRGSVALNGVSLTIASRQTSTFTVALIPLTLRTTNLGLCKVDDELNVEYDMLTKIVSEQLRRRCVSHAQ